MKQVHVHDTFAGNDNIKFDLNDKKENVFICPSPIRRTKTHVRS